ncbi:MAG: tryptophan--tRNA ligase, partial [Armatimonadota bacterium]|nr:tryptophan--tRNA ligase [Armatimonadota bacterium]
RADIGHPETCPVFQLHLIYSKEEATQIERKCKAGEIGCVQDKQELAKAINQRLEPIRQRRRELEQKPEVINQILEDGAKRARAAAQETMEKVRASMAFSI